MNILLDTLKLVLLTVYFCIVNSIKSILPNGVLPRKSVRDKKVLITGSGSGIGRMMSIEFAKLGSELILWDVNTKGNEDTKKMVEQHGAKAHAYTVNLSDHKNINEVAQKVLNDVGQVDILINNAGIVTGKKLFDCPDDLMIKTVAVNTNALFFTAKNFLPKMLDADSGHIVTIASMAGKIGCAGLVDYCASKFGACGYHDSLTMEIAHQKKFGVKTTLVCPFFINTGMFDGVKTKSPLLFPILEPDYVIECIMEAILTDRPLLIMPRSCYIITALVGILPFELYSALADYFGSNSSMDEFKGRQKVE
ncbi:unnamed protein product [Caenorhabditis bovis]|uniref:Uncharacterized protein n=1 Tax=Caenorhabditis bovis TaxID=2654633 RepID=A0A8S1EDY3_9PELO|nr:unnamed protein product [Caenorhabditis bovis]